MPVTKQQFDDALICLMNPLDEAKANDFSILATYAEEQDARDRRIFDRAWEWGETHGAENVSSHLIPGWSKHRDKFREEMKAKAWERIQKGEP